MSELDRTNKQHEIGTAERSAEGIEQAEKLAAEREQTAEKAHETEKTVDDARKELEKATIEKEAKKEKRQEQSPAEQRKAKILDGRHGNRKLSFKKTMSETRAQMPVLSRTFSKVIHNPVVEKTSEAIGNTIARPNAILSGSLFALIFTTGIYFWAKYAGYGLSGFETIAAFIIGWLVGIIVDFARIMITGKQ